MGNPHQQHPQGPNGDGSTNGGGANGVPKPARPDVGPAKASTRDATTPLAVAVAALAVCVLVAGVVGYVAKGLVLAVAGILLVVAVLRADPSKATGLDGAVKTLGSWPAGPTLLVIAAIGLAAYGVYAFVMARWARM